MGISPSIQRMSPEEQALKDLELRVANFGTLPILQKAFNNLAGSEKNCLLASTLEECLRCRFFKLDSEEYAVPAELPKVADRFWSNNSFNLFYSTRWASILASILERL